MRIRTPKPDGHRKLGPVRVGITTTSEGGKEIFLNIPDAGEVFGEIALLDGKNRTAGAVAMEPSEILRIRRSDFLPFLERNPKLCIRLMTVLCERIRWTSDIIEDTIFLDIPHRLAKRLRTLMIQYGTPTESGTRIDLLLSQESLGQMLGATRESINKGIRSLEAAGIIVHDKGYIVVRDSDLLNNFVRRAQDS
jgi:CRP-like cAMP-binding protein